MVMVPWNIILRYLMQTLKTLKGVVDLPRVYCGVGKTVFIGGLAESCRLALAKHQRFLQLLND